jgi:hypothetical protein
VIVIDEELVQPIKAFFRDYFLHGGPPITKSIVVINEIMRFYHFAGTYIVDMFAARAYRANDRILFLEGLLNCERRMQLEQS